MSNTLKFGNGQWATKKGSTLAYNSENGNYKPLPFTFDRASSATRVNKDGLIETVGSGEPRIDFKDDSKGALLLEPQRANLCTYSVNTTGSGWFAFDVTRIATNILSPDGSLTATRLESTGVNDSLTLFHSGNAGIDYTGSFFAKSVDGGGTIKIRVGDFGSTQDITLTNEWQRFSFTSKPTTTAVRFAVILDGLSSQVDVWGFQLEQGSYATSYIPTNGSTVTRVAETMPSYLDVKPLNIGNSYTLFLDADLNDLDNNKVFCAISNSNSVLSFTIRNIIGGIRLYNNLDASYPVGSQLSSNNKFVMRIDDNSYNLFVKGLILSGSLGTARDIGEIRFYGSNTELKINNFNIYNTALSDAECEALVN